LILPCCRSAISRAYYGLFHAAAAAMRPHGITVPASAAGHAEAIRYLQNCGDAGVALVASALDTLRSLRNAADYDLSDAAPEDRPTADPWLKKAKGHAEALAVAFGGPGGPALAAGIRTYQARIRGRRTGR
jgi:uncharacterized protein (UPF0332 family)